LLRQAVESLRRQDYPHFEVILIDDGSSSPAALTVLKELKPEFEQRGWRIVWQDNRYLGAARNAAVREARGEYLLFMDDDNLAKPHEISTLVAVARRTGADVVTALMDFFSEIGLDGGPVRECRWLCSGVPSLAVGLSRNCFGDANALVRRAAFDAVGGFTEDRGVTHEDWEFFVKVVMHGLKLEVVPEALFWYRVTPDSMIRRTPRYHNYLRHLRPYLEEVPEPYRDIVRLAQGLSMRCADPPTLWQPGRRASAKPLRYEIADAINERLRPLKRLHGLGRRLLQNVVRFVRGGGA
jgi:glycosyltransferase involved in cell wall biosynthesis